VGMESLKYRWRTRIDYAEQKSALARLQMSGLWWEHGPTIPWRQMWEVLSQMEERTAPEGWGSMRDSTKVFLQVLLLYLVLFTLVAVGGLLSGY